MFHAFRNFASGKLRGREKQVVVSGKEPVDEYGHPDPFGAVLTSETVNNRVVEAQYAVRGAVVARALALEAKLADPKVKGTLNFDKIVYCNIGNPHRLGQKPITFARQVLALTTMPGLLENEAVVASMPPDVVGRAKHYLKCIPGGTGAYTNSQGLSCVREEVAEFLFRRDGYRVNLKNIYLTNGASPAIQNVIQLLIRNERDALLLPVPEYPLYSASLTLSGGTKVGYYLDEAQEWGLEVSELRRALNTARLKGLNVRALMVTNPGNPTGQCLSVENMEAIVKFCVEERLVLLADEVYQENVWSDDKRFVSFKKVASDMGVLEDQGEPSTIRRDSAISEARPHSLELFSFHSISKGFFGECGRRGGVLEVAGCSSEIDGLLYKLASVNLCSNVDGQLMMGMMCNPPLKGEPSYELFARERAEILNSLRFRANLVHKSLESMQGVSCNVPQGALYAFPQLSLPQGAVAAARDKGIAADGLYCMEMLEETGIVIIPGSGFGQRDGTYHFRTTILPPLQDMEHVMQRMEEFHEAFMTRYATIPL